MAETNPNQIPDVDMETIDMNVEAARRPVAESRVKQPNRFKRKWQSYSRRKKIVIISLLVLLIAGGLFLALHRSAAKSQTASAPPKPTTVASPLTGVLVTPQLASRPVTAIMIENSLDARPQSGLQDAGVVFEAIAEGGITRFMAMFQDTSPQYIGPVRSLRPYYIDYAGPFQASIVHVGGSPDALSQVTNGNYRNLDQFYNADSFFRIDSRDAPHDVYTSFAKLDALNKSKGYTKSTFTSWARKDDQKLATPTATAIDLAVSGPDFHVHYDYNPTDNTYLRSEGGAKHLDLVSSADTTGVQLKPKVVIAMSVPLGQGALDASGAYYSDYDTVGTGTAYVFQDGGMTQVAWTKSDINSQLLFTDSQGNNIKFNRGQTWITLVSDINQITHSAK